jgi:alpha-N-arabinofuranosidase|tara:strand:+ start:308 stop:700 length:393 start_codon:yes stop_codon:yes gene_type:complete
MLYDPIKPGVQAGISLFQKDDNYFIFTVEKNSEQHVLKLFLKERKKEPVVFQETFLKSYNGTINLKIISEGDTYKFSYSLDDGTTYQFFAETSADKILSKGYTGAYLGLYVTSKGKNSKEYADFDWVELN